jgi:diguanylate cyclase (GGDEF)-like protein
MANRERGFTTAAERKALWRKPLDQKLTAARDNYERMVGNAPKEDLEAAELAFKAAKLDVESYEFERDATGAWKGESLGVGLKDIYDNLQKPDGKLDTEAAKGYHVMQINMGELDRLNKVYGHETGNKALSDSCQLIYRKLEEIIGEMVKEKTGQDADWEDIEDSFDIYRSSGNDFTVVLRNIDEKTAAQIQRSLNSDLSIEGLKDEEVPLVATRVPVADSAAYFNDNQENIGQFNPGRAFVDVVKEQGQMLNDIEKNNRRVDRLLKVDDEKKAEALYENYLKKSLGRLFVVDPSADAMGYKDFMAAIEGAKEDDRLEKSIGLAIGDFRSRQKESRHLSSTLSKFVFEKKKEDLKSKGFEISEEEVMGNKRESSPENHGQPEGVEDAGEFLGQLEETRGEKEIETRRNEVKRLEAMVQSDPGNKLVQARLDLAKSELYNSEVKRNPATGLYERGKLFGEIKSRLEQDKPITIVAIDMAFLKYFDKEGGRKTGNAAITAAARMMDAAVREVDPALKAEAYRTGGDEFALTLETDDQEIVRKVQAKIRDLARQTPVPALDQGHSQQYRSEELNFNFGTYSARDMGTFRQELTDAQFNLKAHDKPGMVEESADYLFRIADRQVEIEKTIQRFMLLTRRYYLENFGGENPKGNYATLENYSAKAIGEEGPGLIRQWAEDLNGQKSKGEGLDWAGLHRKVLEHVIESGMKEMEKQAAEGEFTDKLMESAVRERFLKQRLNELQDDIKSLRSELVKSNQDKAELIKKISELEAEVKTVGQLREKISGN